MTASGSIRSVNAVMSPREIAARADSATAMAAFCSMPSWPDAGHEASVEANTAATITRTVDLRRGAIEVMSSAPSPFISAAPGAAFHAFAGQSDSRAPPSSQIALPGGLPFGEHPGALLFGGFSALVLPAGGLDWPDVGHRKTIDDRHPLRSQDFVPQVLEAPAQLAQRERREALHQRRMAEERHHDLDERRRSNVAVRILPRELVRVMTALRQRRLIQAEAEEVACLKQRIQRFDRYVDVFV